MFDNSRMLWQIKMKFSFWVGLKMATIAAILNWVSVGITQECFDILSWNFVDWAQLKITSTGAHPRWRLWQPSWIWFPSIISRTLWPISLNFFFQDCGYPGTLDSLRLSTLEQEQSS
jgi:hypothetical protein